jgi:hypothetical protein
MIFLVVFFGGFIMAWMIMMDLLGSPQGSPAA